MDPSWIWRRVRDCRPLVACLHNHVSAGLVTQDLGETMALVG